VLYLYYGLMLASIIMNSQNQFWLRLVVTAALWYLEYIYFCLQPLRLCVLFPLVARCTRYNFIW